MEYPNYYGILPAAVRYSKEITDFQKIMFAEITALSNRYGYCDAGNEYFAKLYGKEAETISRAISGLAKAGFVVVKIDKEAGNERKIFPTDQLKAMTQKSIAIDKKINRGIDKNVNTPIDKNVNIIIQDNNTTSKNSIADKKLSANKAATTDNFCTVFDDFLDSVQLDKMTWTPKEAKQAYELSKLISKRLVQKSLPAAPPNIKEAFKEFLGAAWQLNDKFLRDGFTPSLLVSQFNRIIIRIQQSHKQQSNGKQIISQDDFNAVIARINAGL